MFIRRLGLNNYSVFRHADFSLETTPDRPVVLFTANNGGGKTSTLFAFRLALHGRRAFDMPLSDRDYFEAMSSRFHQGRFEEPCAIELDFDYIDLHKKRSVKLRRAWKYARSRLSEQLQLIVDGDHLSDDEANDLLCTIVPPEIARYFFFDAERLRNLADWDPEDEEELFGAVRDLLGIELLDQLTRDLTRVRDTTLAPVGEAKILATDVETVAEGFRLSKASLQDARAKQRKARSRYDRATRELRRLGGLLASELGELRERSGALESERASLTDEVRRAAHDILPLLCGRSLRTKLLVELERRRTLDDRETVSTFFASRRPEFEAALKAAGYEKGGRLKILRAIDTVICGKPTAVSLVLPNFSRSEESWMQRVVERELPIMEGRSREVLQRLRCIEAELISVDVAIKTAPDGDPKGEAAIAELEGAQRDLVTIEAEVANLETVCAGFAEKLQSLEKQERLQRVAAFQNRRLALRDELLSRTMAAIPELQERLLTSKHHVFAENLVSALQQLWHKSNRVNRATVDFQRRKVELFSESGHLNKQNLSSGEKQLFATAFIYSLAKMSGRHMPFVIDTPLGRLDWQHRRRFLSEFLPEASHQSILFSTDTEVVGQLYTDLRAFVSHQYELADYNGGVTQPVQLALA